MTLPDFVARLFSHTRAAAEDDLPPELASLVPEAIDLVVATVDPRLRFADGYPDKLEHCVHHTLVYLRALASELPEPVRLSASAWAGDPRLNAFFARQQDIVELMGRSEELRAFFDGEAGSAIDEAIALLVMQRTERSVLGVALEGGVLLRDVPQTTVSFSEARIVAPAASIEALIFELGSRVFRELLNVALQRIEATEAQGRRLENRRAFLSARLKRLEASSDGLECLIAATGDHTAEIAALEAELAQTASMLRETRASLATLEDRLAQVTGVLSAPEQHVALSKRPLRLTRMGVKVEGETGEAITDLVLTEFSLGPAFTRTVAVVCCVRKDLPSQEDLLARGERYL